MFFIALFISSKKFRVKGKMRKNICTFGLNVFFYLFPTKIKKRKYGGESYVGKRR